MRDSILITGGAGRVAEMLSPALRSAFRLRLLDLEEPSQVEGDDEVVTGDARDVDLVRRACGGVVAVLHLAGQPAEADFRTSLLPRNIEATWAVFEAAVRAKVGRFVFASTVQTISGYPGHLYVPAEAAPRPVTAYACTKLWGEALGRFHADTSGLRVVCLRIGAVRMADDPSLADAEIQSVWCSSEDLARLITASIGSSVPFAVVTAVSPPATDRFDTQNPFGWEPVAWPRPV